MINFYEKKLCDLALEFRDAETNPNSEYDKEVVIKVYQMNYREYKRFGGNSLPLEGFLPEQYMPKEW